MGRPGESLLLRGHSLYDATLTNCTAVQTFLEGNLSSADRGDKQHGYEKWLQASRGYTETAKTAQGEREQTGTADREFSSMPQQIELTRLSRT